MIFNYETSFQVENGTVSFAKPFNRTPLFRPVRSEKTNGSRYYETNEFIQTLCAKLYAEVHQKINLDDVRFQIERETFYKYRKEMGERFKKVIFRAFVLDNTQSTIFNLIHFDTTDFQIRYKKGQNVYHGRAPSFTLRVKEKFAFDENRVKISFVEDNIYLKSSYNLASPRLVMRVVYWKIDEPLAENKTFEVEYQLPELEYIFELVVNLNTTTVALNYALVSGVSLAVPYFTLAEDQADPSDDKVKNAIISIIPFLPESRAYIHTNCEHYFIQYIRGILADDIHGYSDYRAQHKISAEKTKSGMFYFGPPGVPSFSDLINIDDANATGEKFVAQYTNMTFHNLSSTYSLKREIDYDEKKVQTVLTTGRTQIRGHYTGSLTSSPDKISQDFEINFSKTIFNYETSFQVENGTVSFAKPLNYTPLFYPVRSEKTNGSRYYEIHEFLQTLSAKLYAEVHQKINLDDVRFQIERETFYNYRKEIGERFKKVIFRPFIIDTTQSTISNLIHFDTTDFQMNIVDKGQNVYNMRAPSFTLRVKKRFVFDENSVHISFVKDNIYLKSSYNLASPRLVMRLVYWKMDEPLAENKTFEVEYQLPELKYTLELVVNLNTTTIAFNYVEVSPEFLYFTSAEYQGEPFDDDEKHAIINNTIPSRLNLHGYIRTNCKHYFIQYFRDVLADGRGIFSIS
ncbi:hypothetical protein V9T40_005025 [Parthenolecanium corni]|uniref:Uncharacterized protein n=1 Tax=Parthenolecanium corni TaxID=536013 RepID=A0AAN9TDD6_9HEMI